MRIQKIELNENSVYCYETSQQVTLYPVIITYKNFWGKIKTKNAYPTSKMLYIYGRMVYFIFVDDLGREFSARTCEKLTNWCKTKEMRNED